MVFESSITMTFTPARLPFASAAVSVMPAPFVFARLLPRAGKPRPGVRQNASRLNEY
jgi:hypothetical protein